MFFVLALWYKTFPHPLKPAYFAWTDSCSMFPCKFTIFLCHWVPQRSPNLWAHVASVLATLRWCVGLCAPKALRQGCRWGLSPERIAPNTWGPKLVILSPALTQGQVLWKETPPNRHPAGEEGCIQGRIWTGQLITALPGVAASGYLGQMYMQCGGRNQLFVSYRGTGWRQRDSMGSCCHTSFSERVPCAHAHLK